MKKFLSVFIFPFLLLILISCNGNPKPPLQTSSKDTTKPNISFYLLDSSKLILKLQQLTPTILKEKVELWGKDTYKAKAHPYFMIEPKDTVLFDSIISGRDYKQILGSRIHFLFGRPGKNNIEPANNYMGVFPLIKDSAVHFTPKDITSINQTLSDYPNSKLQVTIYLTPDAGERFRQFTGRYKGKQVAVVVNNKVYTEPFIADEINQSFFVLFGYLDADDVQELFNIPGIQIKKKGL